MKNSYDVIIIGGGATGAGVARDCAMRGLKSLLLERNDIADGATGRNHGLLHSGARYAVKDPESAINCIQENRILREIAPECIEDTKGLFVTLPGEELSYQSKFVEACHTAGIDAVVIDPELALRMEPSLNRDIIGAVKVPDGAVDPFRLTLLNVLDARAHGAEVLTYHEVNGFIREQDRVTGVRVIDKRSNQTKEFRCQMVVNAAGIWGYGISVYAEINPIEMYASKGTLLIMGHRINSVVLNRCHDPGDADILVPCDTVSVIGTTSIEVPYSEVDRLSTTPEEVDFLIKEGSKLAPSIAHTRIIRAYAGVRPLFSNGESHDGRSISRGVVLLDHSERDGLEGLMTITGGKLITYRLMAEQVTDMVCAKLGVDAKCRTAEVALYRPKTREENRGKSIDVLPRVRREILTARYGGALKDMSIDNLVSGEDLVCECEGVSAGEVVQSIEKFQVEKLSDLRRRTRIGMGTCQGAMCGCRASQLIADHKEEGCCYDMREDLTGFINGRWKGMHPIAWGDTLREGEYMKWLYRGV